MVLETKVWKLNFYYYLFLSLSLPFFFFFFFFFVEVVPVMCVQCMRKDLKIASQTEPYIYWLHFDSCVKINSKWRRNQGQSCR